MSKTTVKAAPPHHVNLIKPIALIFTNIPSCFNAGSFTSMYCNTSGFPKEERSMLS